MVDLAVGGSRGDPLIESGYSSRFGDPWPFRISSIICSTIPVLRTQLPLSNDRRSSFPIFRFPPEPRSPQPPSPASPDRFLSPPLARIELKPWRRQSPSTCHNGRSC